MRVERDSVSLGAFEFASGESIPELTCAYETYGEYTGDNAVLVCHALTGSQRVTAPRDGPGPGEGPTDGGTGPDQVRDDQTVDPASQARAWWRDVVGPGQAIDTNRYHVVCVNVPGSCYGTTGPASEGPDGEPYGPDFPPVTVGDWTRAQRQVLDALGIDGLHAVVGGSVGGMNALEWAKRYPDDVRRVAPIAAAPRLDSQCLALDAIARRAITTDPDWQGGRYYGEGASPDDGLATARRIGHVMYLSKDSMERRFGRRSAGRDAAGRDGLADPAADFFPYREVESYLDHRADAFVDRFDANSYLWLTRAMDDYDLAAGYADDAAALSDFEGEALVMSFTGDWHFTVEQNRHLAGAFRDAGVDVAHHVVDSDHGHDAFLVEPEHVGPPLADFLAEGVDGRAVTDAAGATGREHAPVHTSLIGD